MGNAVNFRGCLSTGPCDGTRAGRTSFSSFLSFFGEQPIEQEQERQGQAWAPNSVPFTLPCQESRSVRSGVRSDTLPSGQTPRE